ncbi:hypothetical protein AAZX31_05G118100 [Glycine max]|uniref:Uncharacterized protein n=1 Tax=Glycine max TaxID=3847 RepID=K7KPW7_SOYBN|nr:uncharacterized protein LOC102659480 [Glycine max]XP_028232430.1 uncharacterized protein LOC114412657 [Glycine soja]KAG5029209.1 hypothetical protein JHK87_012723 [Glycine soja]KAG5040683.1 hypothetical protein JHK85_013159 [Glycine max]KAG5057821.1 hypothetical protein JHK86_012817 [Glycine max]KAG5154832.1 hypothetical protein JHK82_012801 [Glycine max]KAH1134086.1 hypothetical protein GYH30_012484 [Glycine max]|eukprot:XP_006580036.1 uncharacterized protein LOC102659480 [Glycine max]
MDNKIRPLSVSSHSNFFSSLKQVEKRLKLDQTLQPAIESQIQESTLGSPIFLQSSGSQICPSQDSSEPPQAFLSVSQEFPTINQDPSHSQTDHITSANEAEDNDDDDDIEQLMQLLGLSEVKEQRDGDFDEGDSCHCDGGFYAKIVGVEGPKCRKEVLRLDGWINHFMNGGGEEKQEPLRLAHLLLGKSAFVSDGAFGELDFPSTIQEFLHTDPPTD